MLWFIQQAVISSAGVPRAGARGASRGYQRYLAREDEAAEQQRQVVERVMEERRQMRVDTIFAATHTLALATDIASRVPPRGIHVSAEELRAYQDRADNLAGFLGAFAITHPSEQVSHAARDLLVKLPLSLGTMTNHGTDQDPARENSPAQAAVDSATQFFEAVRTLESARNDVDAPTRVP